MYTRSEGFFKGYDDTKLFFQIWKSSNEKGKIIITHGQGEHSECYSRLTQSFSESEWSFYAWDLRGHGRSEGRRGYVANFDEYCQDFQLFYNQVSQELTEGQPLILMSHSMGGLIQAKSLLKNPEIKATGLVFSSPLLGLSMPVPGYKEKAAHLFNSFLPQITMGNEIRNDMLTRDPEVIREFEHDALRHGRISPGAFLGFLSSFEFVLPRAAHLKLPALFQIPAQDPIVNSETTKKFFENYGGEKKELCIYEGAKHELYNDINREEVYTDFKKYLTGLAESK